jgi:hypothetical protein
VIQHVLADPRRARQVEVDPAVVPFAVTSNEIVESGPELWAPLPHGPRNITARAYSDPVTPGREQRGRDARTKSDFLLMSTSYFDITMAR